MSRLIIRYFIPLMFLALATLGVGASQGLLSRIRRLSDPSSYNCRTELSRCAEQTLAPYEFRNIESAQQFLANHTRVSQFVTDFQTVTDCGKDIVAIPGCEYMSNEVDVMSFLAGYLSSPGTVDLIVAMASSPCVTEEEKLEELLYELLACSVIMDRAARQEGSDLCAAFDHMWLCAKEKVVPICGQAAGDLVSSVEQYALSPAMGPSYLQYLSTWSGLDLTSCGDQLILVRRYVRDALPLLSKLRK